MITAPEVGRSMRALWGVVSGDDEAIEGFELSVDGFFRSFWAAALAFPFAALAEFGGGEAEESSTFASALRLIAFPLEYVVSALVAIGLLAFLGMGRRAIPLVIASNWLSAPASAIVAVFGAIAVNAPPAAAANVMTPIVLLALWAQWRVTRAALRTHAATCLGVMAFSLLAGALWFSAVNALAVAWG